MPGEKPRKRVAENTSAANTGDAEKKDVVSKKPRIGERTDYTRWRMLDEESRQTWHYLEDDEAAKAWPQNDAVKWYLGMPIHAPELPKPKNPRDAIRNGLTFFEKLQQPSGHWGCEYGGPMFLLPGFVITWYITNTPISWAYATEIKNYIFAHADPEDGGWGLHTDGDSSALGTALNYITLRILGIEADHPKMVKARATLHELGGATHSPHWGKFWMAVLGVAGWDIVNPAPPELWLLPDWVPFAPWRWWIHIRAVFLPMSYIYSRRWVAQETELVRELRKELFVEPWETINWAAHRNSIAEPDNYHPKTSVLNALNWFLVNIWQPLRPRFLQQWAESWVTELMAMEDENTDYGDLAPVNSPMQMICCYIIDGPESYSVRRHREKLHEFLWLNKDGLLCSGTNGVQCWDTAFVLQAIYDTGLHTDERFKPMVIKALGFLDVQQMRDDVKDQAKCYRQQRKGGWSFSNKAQGYAVSDCIAEALKSIILLQKTPGYPTLLDDQRIFDAVDTLITFQNKNGAVSSYEPPRAGPWLEWLNAAEVFGRIMIEYDYPECTTAVVTALSLFQKHWSEYRTEDINNFIDRAVAWIKTDQRKDGSWYGSWGICFTYAAMFALESLASIGEYYDNSDNSKRGCDFLISKQREDGGWSECFRSCERMEYIEHPDGSLVVQTAWALIALMKAKYPHRKPIQQGIKLLMDRQQPNGEWLQEAIEGVFNKTCVISFPNYKFYFTMKAMGMFATMYPDETVI